MNSSRRSFLKWSALALTGGLMSYESNSMATADSFYNRIGIQLYSVREDMKVNSLNTLSQLKKMGFVNLEHAGYNAGKFYGFDAKKLKNILDDLGLKMVSGHVSFGLNDWDSVDKAFSKEWAQTVDDAATVGQSFLITPWMDEGVRGDYDKLMNLLELFNKCGELCKKSGMKFGYHNHDFEFNSNLAGRRLFDIIVSELDPQLVTLQLDMGNMFTAGASPIEILNTYPGRFDLLHVKDEMKSESGEMNSKFESTILGKGVLDVRGVVELAKKRGTSYFIIEQESYQGRKPMECMKSDLEVMKGWHL